MRQAISLIAFSYEQALTISAYTPEFEVDDPVRFGINYSQKKMKGWNEDKSIWGHSNMIDVLNEKCFAAPAKISNGDH